MPMLMSIAIFELRVIRPLQRVALRDRLAGLVREQVHRVAGVVPEQVVGPAARLAERVHVGAAEEVGLHVHLQHLQLAGDDLLVHPLVARVEAARVAGHRDEAGLLLHLDDRLGVRQRVGHRDLDLDVLAGAHALHRLLGVHLRGRRQDDGLDARLRQALAEVARTSAGCRTSAATSFVASGLPPASVTTSMPGMLRIASMCLMPNAPCPATQIFMTLFCLGGRAHLKMCPYKCDVPLRVRCALRRQSSVRRGPVNAVHDDDLYRPGLPLQPQA